ncbi:MAG: nucleoside-diphosphate sugar epimerase/dehydratase, partial [Bacteroidota bacterium]
MKLSRKIFNWYSQNVISRWTVFVIDNLLVALTFWVSLLLLSDFQDFNTLGWFRVLEKSAVVLLLYAMSCLMFLSFVGIIRHTSIADASRILRANSAAAIVLLVLHTLTTLSSSAKVSPFNLTLSLILTHYLLLTFVMIWSRFMFKGLFNQFNNKERPRKRYLIYGAGSSGRMTLSVLSRETRSLNTVVAFLDDDDRMQNKSIEGVPILSSSALNSDFLENRNIDELIVSIQNIEPRRKKAIVDLCLSRNIQIKVVPPLEHWINGELSLRQIAPVAIEELLQRDPINLSNPEVSRL